MTRANRTSAGKIIGTTPRTDTTRAQRRYHSDTSTPMPHKFGEFDEPDYQFFEQKKKMGIGGFLMTATARMWYLNGEKQKAEVHCNITFSDLLRKYVTAKGMLNNSDLADMAHKAATRTFGLENIKEIKILFLPDCGFRAVIKNKELCYE